MMRIQIYKVKDRLQAENTIHPTLKHVASKKTTPGKAEKPFSNFTEHFIPEYKFSLEQNEKAEVYLVTM